MPSKTAFFQEIQRGRWYRPSRALPSTKIAQLTPKTSTEVIMNLQPDEIAIIDYSLVPYGFREGPEATERFPMFMKRGPPVMIETPKSPEDALEDGTGPTTKRIEKYKTLDDDVIACCISWYCHQDSKYRKVSAHTVLKGTKLYVFSELEKREKNPNKNHLIKVHDYGIDRENKSTGASMAVSVPSLSRDRPYTIVLNYFPFLGSEELWVWQHLETKHSDCGSKDFSDIYWQRDPLTGKRRKQHDIVFCFHDVAAYFAIAKEESLRVRRERPSEGRIWTLHPFPLFTQLTVDVWHKLRNQVFFGSKDYARPLKDFEGEIELHRFFARTNPRETMYIKNNMRFVNYNWRPNIPLKEPSSLEKISLQR